MKRLFLILSFVFSCLGLFSQTESAYDVIPVPQKISLSGDGSFTISQKTKIQIPTESNVINEQVLRNAKFLSEYIKQQTGLKLSVKKSDKTIANSIKFVIDKTIQNEEGYRMTVSENGIMIAGKTPAGQFYGIQNLRKVIGADKQLTLPCAILEDSPRFAYRGTHFDCARHFFPVEFVKKYIDILALHGVNKFHWHITDDQGWRFEVKAYPKLIEVGSVREKTVIGQNTNEYDNTPYGGYYTQKQCREIVKYAADRYITVIPEVDMPGHMQGALAAYPNLGCTGGPYKVWPRWGVSDDVLCAGNSETVKFLHAVLDELTDVFPSELIHLGGDECPKVRWKVCPKCQAKAKELALSTSKGKSIEDQLQTYLLKDAEAFLAKKGRRVIGWNEILAGGIGENTTIMSWMGEDGGRQAAKMGHDAIMTPVGYCYFDYCQSEDHSKEPLSFNSTLLMKKVYNYDPIPADFSPEESKHIIGVQANLWTEYITTPDHAMYMLLPRLAALSEVQWMIPSAKNYDQYLNSLKRYEKLYEMLGFNYRK